MAQVQQPPKEVITSRPPMPLDGLSTSSKSLLMPPRTVPLKKAIINQHKAMWDVLNNNGWRDHFRDLSEHVQPRLGRYLTNDTNKGHKYNQKILDGSGTISLRTLAHGMMTGITSPARPWFKLTISNKAMAERATVKNWLHRVTQLMSTIFSKSNLYQVLPQLYEELVLFGTGAMGVFPDFEDVIRVIPYTAGSYSIGCDGNQRVRRFTRKERYTVEQLVSKYGFWNCSKAVQENFLNGNYSATADILQVIMPNYHRDATKDNNRNRPFLIATMEEKTCGENGDDTYLELSGFKSFPIMAPRWHVTGNDDFGRGPGMDALPDIKSLQVTTKRKMQTTDKNVQPPLLAHPRLKNTLISHIPGSVTFADMENNNATVRPTYQVQQNIAELIADIQDTRRRIQQAFYADLFLMLAADDKTMTAREVAGRQEEKLLMLGPVMERINTELLNPLIDRTFEIMQDAGLFAPGTPLEPPAELQGSELKVEFTSMLAQAQQIVETSRIERFMGFAGNLAGVNPGVLDKVNMDEAIDEYAELVMLPPRIVRSDEEVAAIRAAREEQAANAQAAAALPQMAQTASLLSKADTSGSNLLGRILGPSVG